jgi:hypothetical protein
MLYLKDSAISALPEYIYPSDYVFDRGERESFVADMTRRLETYRKTYNWFADQSVGPLRCKALDLFRSVSFIIYKVDCFRGDMAKIPQQELVILSQLYSHLSQILDMCMDSNSAEAERNLEEIPVMMTSLDGMRYNLEDVEDVLLDALDERCINSFKVVK